jgi:hypothetical protein
LLKDDTLGQDWGSSGLDQHGWGAWGEQNATTTTITVAREVLGRGCERDCLPSLAAICRHFFFR